MRLQDKLSKTHLQVPVHELPAVIPPEGRLQLRGVQHKVPPHMRVAGAGSLHALLLLPACRLLRTTLGPPSRLQPHHSAQDNEHMSAANDLLLLALSRPGRRCHCPTQVSIC